MSKYTKNKNTINRNLSYLKLMKNARGAPLAHLVKGNDKPNKPTTLIITYSLHLNEIKNL